MVMQTPEDLARKDIRDRGALFNPDHPGLKKNVLTRAEKREHLASYYKLNNAAADLILDKMYGEQEPQAAQQPEAPTGIITTEAVVTMIEAAHEAAQISRSDPEPGRPILSRSDPSPVGTGHGFSYTGRSNIAAGEHAREEVNAPSVEMRQRRVPRYGFLDETNFPKVKILPLIPKLSGNVCKQCGSAQLIRTGKCETCQECHWNEGCG
jgi:hypothetical protein